jgi:hypothetical protein
MKVFQWNTSIEKQKCCDWWVYCILVVRKFLESFLNVRWEPELPYSKLCLTHMICKAAYARYLVLSEMI